MALSDLVAFGCAIGDASSRNFSARMSQDTRAIGGTQVVRLGRTMYLLFTVGIYIGTYVCLCVMFVCLCVMYVCLRYVCMLVPCVRTPVLYVSMPVPYVCMLVPYDVCLCRMYVCLCGMHACLCGIDECSRSMHVRIHVCACMRGYVCTCVSM
jgi:hypothetical protein